MLPKRFPLSEVCCVVVIACAIASGCDSGGSDDADVATSCFDQVLESTWPEGRADLDASCAYTLTYTSNLDVPDTLRFAGTYTRREHILQFNRPDQDPFFASYNGTTAIFDLPGLSEAWVPTRPGAEKKPGIRRTESKSCTLPDDSFDLVRINGSALPRFVISSRHEDAAITSGTLSFRDTRFDMSGQYEWRDRSNPSSPPRIPTRRCTVTTFASATLSTSTRPMRARPAPATFSARSIGHSEASRFTTTLRLQRPFTSPWTDTGWTSHLQESKGAVNPANLANTEPCIARG